MAAVHRMLRSMPRQSGHDALHPATGVLAMCGVVAGTALQLQQSQLWSQACYAILLLTVASGLVLLRCCMQERSTWAMALLWLVLAWALTGWRAAHFDAHRMPAQWEGRDIRLMGLIVEMPQRMERGMRLRVDVEQAWSAQVPEAALALPPHIALSWYGELPPQGLRAGQRWEWTVRLKAPHGERNPYGMDWELWQWSQGIQATGYIRQGKHDAPPRWLAQTAAAPVAQLRGVLHQAMQPPVHVDARYQASMGVVQALVTGAQSSITRSDWQLFRDTGIAHLVSISGLHITMFAWLAIGVVNSTWRRSMRLCLWCPAPIAAAWAGLVLAALYAVFSGWGIPAQRTMGMLAVVVWMRTSARQWPWPYVWLSVLTVVVLLDPWSLLQPGFWLSFVAVGVLFASQPLVVLHHQGIGHWLRKLLHEQCVVGIALAPLSLLLFGQISVIGMLANLWAIPWVTLVVTPLSMLGAVYAPLWEVAAHAVSAMVWVLECMANWPVAVLYFAQPPWWVGLAGGVGCLWLVLPWDWRWRVLAVPVLLPMLLWVPAAPEQGQLEVLALDVGQGSAALVRTQHHSLLFDAGPRWSANSDAGERIVVPVLRALGVQPTAMMVSHSDGDHAGGAMSIQHAFPKMQWWGAGGVPCVQGQRWMWDGVQFEVLHPHARPDPSADSSNALSCVLRIRSATGQQVLLTGDIGVERELALVRQYSDLRADVIFVPHHGSKSSSSLEFIAQVQPHFAVIQAGYLNRYGHPDPGVMQRYVQAGAVIVTSAQCGAGRWRSQHPKLMQCERAIARRYWSHVVE